MKKERLLSQYQYALNKIEKAIEALNVFSWICAKDTIIIGGLLKSRLMLKERILAISKIKFNIEVVGDEKKE